MQFRRKPTVVEAFQWQGYRVDNIPAWFYAAVRDGKTAILHEAVIIRTPEGTMTAFAGHWIIKTPEGVIYPCAREVFTAHYVPADAPTEEAEPVYGTDRPRFIAYAVPLTPYRAVGSPGTSRYDRYGLAMAPTDTPTLLRAKVEGWLAKRYGAGVYVVSIDTTSAPEFWFISVRFAEDDSAANENSAPGVG